MMRTYVKNTTVILMLCVSLAVSASASAVLVSESYAAGGTVSQRLAEVRKDFPNNSRINKKIEIWTVCDDEGGWPALQGSVNGGCNALVTYVTMKVFHEPYVPGAASYKKIGKTVNGKNRSSLAKLFKKAKKGDVIRIHNGTTDYHFAIFLSRTSKGVRVYEGNVGGKNRVKYNNLWTWGNTGYWKKNVSLYRCRNYKKTDSGKAALNLKKGAEFTYKGITYKVTKAGIRQASVRVISKDENAGKTPKAIGINYETANRLITYGTEDWDSYAAELGEEIRIRSYNKDKGRYYDEQYFIVQ